MWLVIAAADTQIDNKALTKHLKVPSGKLRAADNQLLESVLGVKAGSVCLFALNNDKAHKVKVILDQKLQS